MDAPYRSPPLPPPRPDHSLAIARFVRDLREARRRDALWSVARSLALLAGVTALLASGMFLCLELLR